MSRRGSRASRKRRQFDVQIVEGKTLDTGGTFLRDRNICPSCIGTGVYRTPMQRVIELENGKTQTVLEVFCTCPIGLQAHQDCLKGLEAEKTVLSSRQKTLEAFREQIIVRREKRRENARQSLRRCPTPSRVKHPKPFDPNKQPLMGGGITSRDGVTRFVMGDALPSKPAPAPVIVLDRAMVVREKIDGEWVEKVIPLNRKRIDNPEVIVVN